MSNDYFELKAEEFNIYDELSYFFCDGNLIWKEKLYTSPRVGELIELNGKLYKVFIALNITKNYGVLPVGD